MRQRKEVTMLFHRDHFDISIGVNVTVRLGDKWFEELKDGSADLLLAIADYPDPDTPVFNAKSMGVFKTRVSEIPESIIDMVHSNDIYDKDSLISALYKAYGDDFDESYEVTVVTFYV